jgi:hypothetical protein
VFDLAKYILDNLDTDIRTKAAAPEERGTYNLIQAQDLVKIKDIALDEGMTQAEFDAQLVLLREAARAGGKVELPPKLRALVAGATTEKEVSDFEKILNAAIAYRRKTLKTDDYAAVMQKWASVNKNTDYPQELFKKTMSKKDLKALSDKLDKKRAENPPSGENKSLDFNVDYELEDLDDADFLELSTKSDDLIRTKDGMDTPPAVGPCSLAEPGNATNWIEALPPGLRGLPDYMCNVAQALIKKGRPKSIAIRMGIGIVKNWARGKGGVKPDTIAAAIAAVAKWEAMKAYARTHELKDASGKIVG